MTTAGPASLPDWPYKSTPALALDEGAHIGTVQLLVSRPTLRTYSAGAECLVVALGGCSLSVAANVHAEGCRPLVLAFDIFMKPSLSHWGVRTSEGVDVWPLRARSIAVEAAAADVPDNRPLSDAN
jgi:hypothetical protein